MLKLFTSFASIQKSILPLVEKRFPEGIFRVHGLKEKIVVLTIDDGPSSKTTQLLGLLARFNAKATFFIHTSYPEQASEGQNLIQAIHRRGHEIGNHMPEDIPSISLSKREFERQFRKADALLRSWGITPRFFRAAGGRFDSEKMMPSLKELGYEQRFIMASFLPWDTHLPFPKIYAAQLIRAVFPGAIVVFHDGEQKGPGRLARTFVSLERFLIGMKNQGYRVVSLGEAWKNEGF
jgi:peptidoglycan/xylan/chitin deacetylase (PgdA/CDA1 family)